MTGLQTQFVNLFLFLKITVHDYWMLGYNSIMWDEDTMLNKTDSQLSSFMVYGLVTDINKWSDK